MARLCSFFIISLLFCFSIIFTHAARPQPVFHDASTPTKIHPEVVDVEAEGVGVEESCEGATEDECLMRRTLSAHLDYIYTQKHGKSP